MVYNTGRFTHKNHFLVNCVFMFSISFYKRLKLKSLHRFNTTAIAVEEITAIQEGKLGKGLKQFLSDEIIGKGKSKETLAVFDAKLGQWTRCTHSVPRTN